MDKDMRVEVVELLADIVKRYEFENPAFLSWAIVGGGNDYPEVIYHNLETVAVHIDGILEFGQHGNNAVKVIYKDDVEEIIYVVELK